MKMAAYRLKLIKFFLTNPVYPIEHRTTSRVRCARLMRRRRAWASPHSPYYCKIELALFQYIL
jgi:hypothetical protein